MSKMKSKRPYPAPPKGQKLYVTRKYIMARSLEEAVRKEKKAPLDDCWVEDDWKKGNADRLESAIGFMVEPDGEMYEVCKEKRK